MTTDTNTALPTYESVRKLRHEAELARDIATEAACSRLLSVHESRWLPKGSRDDRGNLGPLGVGEALAHVQAALARRESEPEPTVYNFTGALMDYEGGDLSEEDTLVLFQYILDNGYHRTLQGHYGRMTQNLLNAGLIQKKSA